MTTCVAQPPPGFLDTTHGPVILDGAMATELMARGMPPAVLPERWLLDHPEDVVAVHAAHVAAGAHAVLTCTFMTHPQNLREQGLQSFCGEIRRVAVACARSAGAPSVLGVVGPLPPETAPDAVTAAAEAAAWDLVRAGVDGLVLETITQLEEGVARVRGAVLMGVPVVASVVPGTPAAEDGADAARRLRGAGAHVVGVNCARPDVCAAALRSMRTAGAGQLWAKPSPGAPGAMVPHAQFVTGCVSLLELGVRYLGGCCGSTAEDVRAMAHALTST